MNHGKDGTWFGGLSSGGVPRGTVSNISVGLFHVEQCLDELT